jgi:hypothetical protein
MWDVVPHPTNPFLKKGVGSPKTFKKENGFKNF